MRYALLAVCFAFACSGPAKPATPPTPPPAAPMGALSEEEFKALHVPPEQGTAPARKGQQIDLAGGKAYLSLPAGQGPFPAIVVIHEWWGLNEHVEHWADRLASAGWAAIAVDLYDGKVATTREDALAYLKAVDDTKAAGVISAAFDYVAKDPRILATKRAVIGWCFGGGWSFRTALAHPELDGAIIYYGGIDTDPAKLAAIKARVLGIFATRDKGIPNEEVDKFEAALKQAGVRAEIKRYDAEHAFANPSNPIYDPVAAADAWKHVLAFLDALSR